MEKEIIAHVKSGDDGRWELHSLYNHLLGVAKLAGEKAAHFGGNHWASLSGLWHDLGKYRPAFQNYINSASGYDPEAHIETGQGRVDHSTAGAIHAVNEMGTAAGRILAYLIAGHHAGLPDWHTDSGRSGLEARLAQGRKKGFLDEALANGIPDDIAKSNKPTERPLGNVEGLHLWIRMIFSCLIDADFLDTELFMSPEKSRTRAKWPEIFELQKLFNEYMTDKTLNSEDTSVNRVRRQILQNCREAANQESGIYTLTVPTGGGKTLSGMAFALDHAAARGKRRIIVVIPYTSIIEQTMDQYQEIFGTAVIEHHSNLDSEKESSKSRLACENWDAPIIVTTNVQLLESLFASRTSRCRKLHNIVNSVIIMDEAQLMPPEFLQPVLDVLRLLNEHYGVTIVLSTATQPALGSEKDSFGRTTLKGLDDTREIISGVDEIFRQLRRVTVHKPHDLSLKCTWKNLADELTIFPSVLVIVNSRKDCRNLFDLLPKGTIHLSGLMCGQHRSKVIAQIKRDLGDGKAVRVVSTQLVEAGVDLDFPVVYRALSGLDSIVQAAGRCNREGKLESGKLVVFVPPRPPPKGMLTFAEQATRSVWHDYTGDPLDRKLYTSYFRQFFAQADTDKFKIGELLTKEAREVILQFRTASERFRLIEDKGMSNILVPYGDNGQKLVDMVRATGPERYLMRRLQRYSVTVYKNEFSKLMAIGAVEEIHTGIWIVSGTNVYDSDRGLLVAEDLFSVDPAGLII
jgi:CRISPR-associated endonuclease/helicase Cas3